jgi:hypothetical protein
MSHGFSQQNNATELSMRTKVVTPAAARMTPTRPHRV